MAIRAIRLALVASGAAVASGVAVAVLLAVPATASVSGHFALGKAFDLSKLLPKPANRDAVDVLNCAANGDCTAAGTYGVSATRSRIFVASETNGHWSKPTTLLGAGNQTIDGDVFAMQCTTQGNCVLGGDIGSTASVVTGDAFIAVESQGRWGVAREVAGNINRGNSAAILTVSCPSRGNCAAGGAFNDSSNGSHAFVISESNGRWGIAQQVAGQLDVKPPQSFGAEVGDVSCVSAGNCTAVGEYGGVSDILPFVVVESHGRWLSASAVGPGRLATGGGGSYLDSIACTSAGNCVAGGSWGDGNYRSYQAFVIAERAGKWGPATQVAGTGGTAGVGSVSCPTSTFCAVTGYDYEGNVGDNGQAFVATENNGKWSVAHQIVDTASIGAAISVAPISCTSIGFCLVGGAYATASDNPAELSPMYVEYAAGKWSGMRPVAGTSAYPGSGSVNAVSCAGASSCEVGGSYDGNLAFVAAS